MARGRILLVEDDAALAELVSWHLEREEFEVERTATARKRCCSHARLRPTWCCSTG
jgi:DNA-binding response OmpR family regulator